MNDELEIMNSSVKFVISNSSFIINSGATPAKALFAQQLPGGALQEAFPGAGNGWEGGGGFFEQDFGIVVGAEAQQ
ncbi:MAG: hypothetical protein WKG07_44935 [Hymenobacter sp.]